MVGEFHSIQNMTCRSCQQWHIKANKCVYLQAMSRLTVLIELELGPQCSRQTISVLFLAPISPLSLPEGLLLTFLTWLNIAVYSVCLQIPWSIHVCQYWKQQVIMVELACMFCPYWFMLMYSRVVPCFHPLRLSKPFTLSVYLDCASIWLWKNV